MSTQVIRVEGYGKGSLGAIGRECDRADVKHRNADIDKSLSYLNQSYSDAPAGFITEYEDIKTALNASGRKAKNVVAFEGMLITSDRVFFERLGWKHGEPVPKAVKEFFDRSYEFVKEQIGYRGTDKNILSAKVHYDEKVPHMHVYYIPVTDKWREKVYQRDAQGHVVRNKKGVPQQKHGKDGKALYRPAEDAQHPRITKSEFWQVRGGPSSYRRMQDLFQERVGKAYGLERGQVGSDREHRTKAEWEQEQLDAEKKRLTAEVRPYRKLKVGIENEETVTPINAIVRRKEFEELKEQAKAYTVNRGEIERLRQTKTALQQREDKIDRRERELREREAEVQKREREAKMMIEKQKNLNTVNCSLEQQMRKMEGTIEAQEEKLSAISEDCKDYENAYRFIKDRYCTAVLASRMLLYDLNDGYGVNLPDKPKRLLQAITARAEDDFKVVGDKEDVKMVKTSCRISKSLKEKLPQEHTLNRGFDIEM